MASQKWFLQVGGREKGPYDTASLERSLKDGTVKPSTLAREEGTEEWLPLHAVISPKLSEPPRRAAQQDEDDERHARAKRKRSDLVIGGALCAVGTVWLLVFSRGIDGPLDTRTALDLTMIAVGAVFLIRGAVRS